MEVMSNRNGNKVNNKLYGTYNVQLHFETRERVPWASTQPFVRWPSFNKGKPFSMIFNTALWKPALMKASVSFAIAAPLRTLDPNWFHLDTMISFIRCHLGSFGCPRCHMGSLDLAWMGSLEFKGSHLDSIQLICLVLTRTHLITLGLSWSHLI